MDIFRESKGVALILDKPANDLEAFLVLPFLYALKHSRIKNK
jgi:hypothetical protein